MRWRGVAAIAAAVSAASGCSGTAASGNGGRPVAIGQGYTSDELRKALLTDIAGYRRAGQPDSGEYGSLKAIQNFNQLQAQVKLDKPACQGAAGGPASGEFKSSPAAIAVFSKDDGQTLTETLISTTPTTADAQVRQVVPTGCRTFRALIGGEWSTHEITEATTGRIGDGSRTVGVSTTSGNAHVKTWYVVLHAHSYLATVTLYGPNVTQADAEDIARQANSQADRALR